MKRLIPIIFLLSVLVGQAQQRAQFSQHMINPFVFNPAFAGTEDFIDITMGFRTQWTGLEGAPNTVYLTAHGPVGKEFGSQAGHHRGGHKGWHGVGGMAYADYTGPTDRIGAMAAYAYNLPLSHDVRMSLGVNLGLQQYSYSTDGLVLKHDGDAILQNGRTTLAPDGNIGAFVYSRDFFVGVASHQITQPILFEQNQLLSSEGDGPTGLLNRHYFVQGGTNVPLGYDHLIVPSGMLKMVKGAPISADFSVIFKEKESAYFVGASVRNFNALIALAGVTIDHRWAISYSLDVTLTPLQRYSFGSHELVLSYKLAHRSTLTCPSKFWSH